MSVLRTLPLLAGATLLLSTATAEAGRYQDFYEPGQFDSPAQLSEASKRFWKPAGLKKIAKSDLARVAIVEFNVEYLTTYVYDSNNQAGGLLGMGLKLGGVGKRHWELDETFKENLPETLYAELIAQMNEMGMQVVPLEELRGSEAFQRLRGTEGEVGKKKSYSGGKGYSAQKKQKYEVHSVDGLLDLKDGVFATMDNAKAQAAMLHELPADAALRVWVRLGLDKKGRPVLMSGSHVGVVAGVEVNTMPSGKEVPYARHWGNVDAKKSLAWSEDARAGKDFKGGKGQVIDIDEAEFEKALTEMYPAFMGMALTQLQ